MKPRVCFRVVKIHSLTDSAVRMETWVSSVSNAMCIFFDCKYYSEMFSRAEKIQYHFYGTLLSSNVLHVIHTSYRL